MEESRLCVVGTPWSLRFLKSGDRGPLGVVRVFENLIEMIYFLEVKR